MKHFYLQGLTLKQSSLFILFENVSKHSDEEEHNTNTNNSPKNIFFTLTLLLLLTP